MTDEELIKVHSNAILKIMDNEWQLTRTEVEHSVQETMRHIIAECGAKARLGGES